MDVAVLWPRLFDGGELGALHRLVHRGAAFLPRLTTLVQGGVVEFTAAAHDKRHCLFLLRCRLEFVLERLAHRLLVHSYLFCLIGTKPARGEGHSSPA